MITTITKRDGRVAYFDINKIANAIEKAFQATSGAKSYATCLEMAQEVSDYFENENMDSPSVEQIQDRVERVLIDHGFVQTAKAYILYRAERTRIRNMNDRLMKTFEDITYKDATDSDIKRENANIDGNTAMGSMLKYGSEGAKHFYESYVLNPKHSEAHRNGDIHIHDLDFYTLTTTCCQIDLLKLFENGFSTGHGVLREPNSIASYASLACIAIQSNQNDQHGGQSVPNFDYSMAPGVAKTYKKRYRSNLVNWGMVPFTWDSSLTERLHCGDRIFLPQIAAAVERCDPEVSWCEDFLFNLEYIRRTRLIAATAQPVYCYVKRPGSLVATQATLARTVEMKRTMFAAYKRLYQALDLYDEQKLRVYGYLVSAAKDGGSVALRPPALPKRRPESPRRRTRRRRTGMA